jgi:hypothetical protein
VFTSHIELNHDGSASVQEEILYDFQNQTVHGIFREIPLIFKNNKGNEVTVALTNLSVSDGKGHQLPFEVDGGGNFVKMKIGDPNVKISGESLYVIRYTLLGAMVKEDEQFDGFFYDALSRTFPEPIARARVDIIFPRDIETDDISYACFHISGNSSFACNQSAYPGMASGTINALRFEKERLQSQDGFIVAAQISNKYFSLADERSSARNNYWWKHPKFNINALIAIIFLSVLYIWAISKNMLRNISSREQLLAAIALFLLSISLSSSYGQVPFAIAVIMFIELCVRYSKIRRKPASSS